ncbi:hypothetical protein HYH03_010984 [Edaphochlamys debaryana]|uniref:Uncharacterized protein n=1 Tax=Edaphochlamys debaryana TaxID=47281 RepID=A0A835XUX5_9CHLO|nr:hypothetical protein HYH03_010984 [Edaphochlamys debaryana]|eukprot:KAG2490591.1 hypothetical protein HYH03_010984 [Edaphochlamys debaryana]
MKSRKGGAPGRQGAAEEGEEDGDPTEAQEATGPSETAPASSTHEADGRKSDATVVEVEGNMAGAARQGIGLDLNAASDPPGALGGYLGSESDLPAPAAPSEELLQRLAKPAPAGMRWVMQPDPVAPSASCGFEPCEPAGVASLRGDSAYSLMSGAEAQHAGSKRLRDGDGPSPFSRPAEGPSPIMLSMQHSAHLAQPSRPNPFAAAALAASVTAAAPAPVPGPTHAEALLSRSATYVPLTLTGSLSPGSAPWLQTASVELDGILSSIGLTSDTHPLAQKRLRALQSSEPLALPPAPKHRDPSDLLLRRLSKAAPAGNGAGLGLEDPMDDGAARQLLLGRRGQGVTLGDGSLWAAPPELGGQERAMMAFGAGLATMHDSICSLEALLQ